MSVRDMSWLHKVRVGDVLKSRSGALRTVRSITFKEGSQYSFNVTFTIKHCSWTGRCDTVLTTSDLRYRGFRPTGKRRSLRSRIDRRIARYLDNHGEYLRTTVTCCDVEGVA